MATKPKKDPVAEAILALAEAVKGLESKLDTALLPTKPATVPEGSLPPNYVNLFNSDAPSIVSVVTPPAEEFPFPFEWREVIDTILNKAFKAAVSYRGDGHFELSVFVPREYSNAKPPHWDAMHNDLRFAVLQNSLGTVGVRNYVESIAKNLGPDLMKKVDEDRLKLIGA